MTQPVSWTIAILLREKGFDEKCELGWYLPHPEIAKQNNVEPNTWQLLPMHPLLNQRKAPTIAEVIMWVYEKHNIWVSIEQFNTDVFHFSTRHTKSEYYSVCPSGHRQDYPTPQKAGEAGIKYVLENLIRKNK